MRRPFFCASRMFVRLAMTADGFHGRSGLAAYAGNYRVQRGILQTKYSRVPLLEECGYLLGDGVLKVEESVSESSLAATNARGYPCGFRCECGRPAPVGVDLDDAGVHRWVEGILHVAFADDADMAYDLDGELAQVSGSLRW